jgi:hypothetical protein
MQTSGISECVTVHVVCSCAAPYIDWQSLAVRVLVNNSESCALYRRE